MIDRRAFLRMGLGGAAALTAPPLLVRSSAQAKPAPGPFGHGVASGDPLHDRVVLWTRVTPHAGATPGSGLGGPVRVEWQVARDEAFSALLARGAVRTDAGRDHTVKVDAAGLPPATELWYRFRALGTTSPVGRTRTAPAPGAAVDRLRFGVVSCSHYESGWFSAYRHLAARDDLDLVVHLGDYIYEGDHDESEAVRPFDPLHEIVSLADYRRRHAVYKTDPDLQALHRRYAFVTTIDDHEVTNNSWADGAENHQPDEGDYAARQRAAMQAYFEWMPVRPGVASDPTRIFRSLPFGSLADLVVLDGRTYRSPQVQGLFGDILVTDPAVADPARTMLGPVQRSWLDDTLDRSSAQWRVLANPVMFAPLVLADLPDLPEVTPLIEDVLAGAGVTAPIVLNADQWDGYRVEQRALTRRFGEVGGVVILTGDIHSSWAAEIPADPGSYLHTLGGTSNAVEFVTPAVTSDGFSAIIEDLGIPGGQQLGALIPVVATNAAPWFKYVEVQRQGFGVFEVTPEVAQYDWHYLLDRSDPHSAAEQGPSWRTRAGSDRLEETTPLGPREPAGAARVRSAAVAPVGGVAGPAAQVEARGAAGAPQVAAELPATGREVPLAAAAGAAALGLAVARAARTAGGERTGT